MAVTLTDADGQSLAADQDLVLAAGDTVTVEISGDAGDYRIALVRVSLDPRSTASRYPTRPPRLSPAPSLIGTD